MQMMVGLPGDDETKSPLLPHKELHHFLLILSGFILRLFLHIAVLPYLVSETETIRPGLFRDAFLW